jgi:hypothetical protein
VRDACRDEDDVAGSHGELVQRSEQRLDILRACFAVAAINGSIDAAASFTVDEIALELDLEPPALAKLRGEFADRFLAVQEMKGETTPTADGAA